MGSANAFQRADLVLLEAQAKGEMTIPARSTPWSEAMSGVAGGALATGVPGRGRLRPELAATVSDADHRMVLVNAGPGVAVACGATLVSATVGSGMDPRW